VLESASAATDLYPISYLRSILDARMRRGVLFPAWYLLLVALLGIMSGRQSLRDLEHFAIRHHSVITKALGLELRRPPSDSLFRYFFQQVDVPAPYAAIRDGTSHGREIIWMRRFKQAPEHISVPWIGTSWIAAGRPDSTLTVGCFKRLSCF
jgi:hypothetical protein